MVHSGVSHLQPMYQGDARSLLELMLRIAGSERTLAMPAFFFGTFPELFDLAYYRKYPRFDVRRTPSQMGLVTELFRRTPGVTRSLHPTHSICALGPLANELCATHHLSPWRFGELSPFGIGPSKNNDHRPRRVLLLLANPGPFDGGHLGRALSSSSGR